MFDASHGFTESEISTSPKRLLSIYALLNRIRLCASDAVLTQAVELVKFIMEQYFSPNVSHRRVSSTACTTDTLIRSRHLARPAGAS